MKKKGENFYRFMCIGIGKGEKADKGNDSAISFLFFSLKLWYNEVIMIKWGKEDALPEVY